jgi:hypothetical protein
MRSRTPFASFAAAALSLSVVALPAYAAAPAAEAKANAKTDAKSAGHDAKQETIDLAEGKLALKAPAGWVRKDPSVRIIEHEFAVPKVEGDERDGRVTVMGAGGGVKANVERWKGQFTKLSKESSKDVKPQGIEVHIVDLTGDFKDQRGPLAPAEEHENYRMLGAIVSGGKLGSYFVKFYGPEKTVAANYDAFMKMIDGLEKK